VIIEYCTQNNLQERTKKRSTRKNTKKKPISRSKRHHQVGQRYNKGESIPEIASFYGVKESTVVNNLTKFIQEGHSIRPDGLREFSDLDNEDFKEVVSKFEELGVELLRPVFEALDEKVPYDQLRVVQLYLMVKNNS
jgi:ATP-dependent DNA helicase RecQ